MTFCPPAIILLTSLIAWTSIQATESDRPNIVFLLADDLNTLSVGCYGNADVQTPHLDQLGRDGIIFDNHYNTTAICMASRANVFTGMYEYKTGTNFEHGDMKPEVWAQSYPVLLRQAGYLTAFAGKFGMEVEGKGLCAEDFDFWGGGPGQTDYKTANNPSMAKYAKDYPHSTLSYAAFSEDVIKDCAKKDQPFCLSISFKAPHRPVQPDPKFKKVYQGKTFTKPANFGRQAGKHLSPQSKQGRQYLRFEAWGYDRDYDKAMIGYHTLVYGIDQAVGKIRKSLAEHGLDKNTIVIFTSDNGYICGSHGYASKVLPMEESSRVPLMIYDPRTPSSTRGTRSSALTANLDFAPTFLELAGLNSPSDIDGKSLLPLLTHPSRDHHEQIAFMNTYGALPTQSLSVITPRWKYNYWWYGDETMTPAEELFDLQNDPLELTNLAHDKTRTNTLINMRSRYDRELKKWQTSAVPYNNYQKYGRLFDRSIPWQEKTPRKKHSSGKR